MQSLVDLLNQASREYGDRTALTLESGLRPETWSYQRLWRASGAIARHLQDVRGIARGERVLIYAPNTPQLVAAYFGCMRAGIVLVPLDPESPDEFIDRVAIRTRPAAIIVGHEAAPNTQVPVIDLRDLPTGDGLEDESPEGELPVLPTPDDVVEIVFTSGTTGDPKGVLLTHGNIIANVASLDGIVPRHDYRLLSLLPLSHMLEQTIGLYLPLSYGASVHYVHRRQPSTIFKALQRRRVSTMVVVPLVLEVMMLGIEREVRRRGQWSNWQRLHSLARYLPFAARRLLFRSVHRQLGGQLDFFMCGGAYLSPELADSWERLGIKVVQGYGATECAPVVASNTLTDRMPGSVGAPVEGVKTRIAEDGELLVRGENVTSGYWENSEADTVAFVDDVDGRWYRTGDLVESDRSGRLYIKGRTRDLIVLANGMNVYPEDVERELVREPEVADCVVLGLSDPEGRARVHAVILSTSSDEPKESVQQQLAAAVLRANSRLGTNERISSQSTWLGDDFPRTNTMKVKRREVLAAVEGGMATLPAPQAARGAIDAGASLLRILAELCDIPADSIQVESELADLGIDSLAQVELAIQLEQELGFMADEEQIAAAGTVGQLMQLVERGAPIASALRLPRWSLTLPVRWIRRVLQSGLVFPLHRLACRPFRVEGSQHLVSLTGPALFFSNHSSHLDTPSLLRALPAHLRRSVAVAAAADYFYTSWWLGAVSSLGLNTFPFSRAGAVRSSLEYCGELADAGWSIIIYPEGTRSTTGERLPFERGIGLLAAELRLPVVPVAIQGTHKVLPKGAGRPRSGPVTVHFGEPFTVPGNLDQAELVRLLEDTQSQLLNA